MKTKLSFCRLSSLLIVLALTLFLTSFGCGGGGGGGGGDGGPGSPTGTQQGVFVDSAVEGINYSTASQSGLTDTSGTYKYLAGETITFSIADVVLGQAVAKGSMTPIDLVPGATDETHREVTNICRLVQSLDVNGNLNDGITISAQIRNEVENRPIDFDQSTDDFGNDPDIVALFDTFFGVNHGIYGL